MHDIKPISNRSLDDYNHGIIIRVPNSMARTYTPVPDMYTVRAVYLIRRVGVYYMKRL